MNRPLRRFWSALEQVPGLAAVPSEWRCLLGDEYAAVERFLLPTQRIAGSVRTAGRTCVHEIRRWKGEYLSVCPDGCDTVTLPREELVIHRIDVARLGREIADVLCLDAPTVEAVSRVAGTWPIADYIPYAGFRFAAYLVVSGEPDDINRGVDALCAVGEPFILIAPSGSVFRQSTADAVKRAGSCFLALAELVGQDGDKKLTLSHRRTAQDVLADFRAVHVPQPKASDSMVFFPTPADARWGDVSIRFNDRHSVYVSVKGESGVYHFAQMGMANKKNAKPTEQWQLLERFAEGHGLLDWRNRNADRKNQKRKERLAKDLQRFFRIEGDPFVLEGDGWRSRFVVSVR